MDDETISRIMGNSAYKAGMRLYLSGGMGAPEDIGDGMYRIRTGDGNLVFVGCEGGRFRHHCGCVGPHPCAHESAAMIALYGSHSAATGDGEEDDPAVVALIRDRIACIAAHADDGGDELLEMLDGMASGVAEDIAERVWEPDNTVTLVQMLAEAVRGTGLEGRTASMIASFRPAARQASAEALAGCYRLCGDGEPPWVDALMQSVPEDTLEDLLPMLEGLPGSLCPGALMAAGRFDEFVEARGGDEGSLLSAASMLASLGRTAEARRYAAMLPRPSESPRSWREIAAVHESIGDEATAASYLLVPFIRSPTESALREVMASTRRYSEGELTDMVLEAASGRPTPERLAFLTEHGRSAEVSGILDGMTDQGLAEMYSGRLFGALMARGLEAQAVTVARAYVVRALASRDTSEYGRAAEALLALDSVPPGMTVHGTDAEGFKAGLRRSHGRRTVFWSLYRDEGGTYRRPPRSSV